VLRWAGHVVRIEETGIVYAKLGWEGIWEVVRCANGNMVEEIEVGRGEIVVIFRGL
jgi:hypothetical protein